LADENSSILRRGFSLVLRHQRILWWVFAANLILGGLGASSTARAAAGALHHSLAGDRLANRFDLGMLAEMVRQPSVKLFGHSHGVVLFAAFYSLFLLFLTPGIVTVYLEDRRFSSGEFFGAVGEFFWPFVRLVLWSLIPFVAVDLLYESIKSLSDYVGDRVTSDQMGFFLLLIGCIPVLLLSVLVRFWFDLAQARTVAMKDLRTRRSAARMFRAAFRQAGRVYWNYVAIGVLVWIVTIILSLLWTRVSARMVWLTFLLLEVIMFTHIFGRLWQKACATTWYRLIPEPAPVTPEPVPYAAPEAVVFPDVDAPLTPEIESVPEPPPAESGIDQKLRFDGY
jgi:hypothetical protein